MYSEPVRTSCFLILILGTGCGRTALDGLPRAPAGPASGGTGGRAYPGLGGSSATGDGSSLATGDAAGRAGTDGTGGLAGTGGRGGSGGRDAGPGGGGAAISVAQGSLVTLASDQAGPMAIALDASNVYWGNNGTSGRYRGSIMKVPIVGGTATPIWAAMAVGGIAVNSTNLYWSSLGLDDAAFTPALYGASLAGASTALLAAGFINDPIAVGPRGVYGTGAVDGGVTLVTCPLAGGPMTALVPASDLQQTFASYGIAVDASSVYWTSFASPSAVMKVPLSGGHPTILAKAPDAALGLAVDDTNVYWVTQSAVMTVPTNGGASITLATTQGGFGIALDATNVYWTDHGNPGSVSRVAKMGGATTVLVTGLPAPAGIAVDATSVYWANQGDSVADGSIMKLTPKE